VSAGILLAPFKPGDQPALSSLLRPTGGDLCFCATWDDAQRRLATHPYSVLIVDYDQLGDDAVAFLDQVSVANPELQIVVLSDERQRPHLTTLFGTRFLTHLLSRDLSLGSHDLVVTVQKLLPGSASNDQDVFGLEKYLPGQLTPLTPIQHTITGSRDKETVIQALEGFAEQRGVPSRLTRLACGVADEFVTNAVYNAPVDANGNPKYALVPRGQHVLLQPDERVTMRYASNGPLLAISVSDRFGALTVDTVQRYLAKCFAGGRDQIGSSSSGAGMGFYYILTSLSQLIINIAPGRQTEMIGVLDISGTYRTLMERPKSFNMFVTR
jgi:hypothetical protein